MKRWRLYILGLLLAVIALLGYFVSHELQTSELQAKFFSKIGKQLTWTLGQGTSTEIRFPKVGPFDERLGYTRLPVVMNSLAKNGYEITEQARLSPRFLQLVDEGIFPIYREKNSSGLRIVDRADVALYSAIRPERAFPLSSFNPRVLATSSPHKANTCKSGLGTRVTRERNL